MEHRSKLDRLPVELYKGIINFLPIYSLSSFGLVNKQFYEISKKELNISNEERRKKLMIENSDGMGVGGEELIVCHQENDTYWKKEYYMSPWNFRWKLKYVWWLDISGEIKLSPGRYKISCILWNVYETVFSEIKILGEDNSYINSEEMENPSEDIILRRFDCPGIVDFPKYKHNLTTYINNDFSRGEITDITDKTISQPPISISLLKKYRYSMGEIEIMESKSIKIRIFNVNCQYHKDNMIFECFRIKRL